MRNILMVFAGVRFVFLILCLSFIGVGYMISDQQNPANAQLNNTATVAKQNNLPWFIPTSSTDTIKAYLTTGYLSEGWKKPPVNSINNLGYTGLVQSILDLKRDVVKLLIDHGADVNMAIVADNNNRPLHYAIQKGDQEYQNWSGVEQDGCIRLLLKAGADPMLVNSPSGVPVTFNDYSQKIITNQTPLHLVEFGIMDLDIRMKVVNLLIDAVRKLHGEAAVKTFLNMQDSNGDTFMHVAAGTSDAPWIDRIRDSSFFCLIDMTIKNKKGHTPIDGLYPKGISPTQEVSDELDIMMKKYNKECKPAKK